ASAGETRARRDRRNSFISALRRALASVGSGVDLMPTIVSTGPPAAVVEALTTPNAKRFLTSADRGASRL
ncbi:hypothetical protein, partial [Nocardia cyriacigeorgica]|uniref:hypothetical protein n=1 Tax=Nocardia cyriacigeorgica TaxID=135487 RepID=UPI001CA481BC